MTISTLFLSNYFHLRILRPQHKNIYLYFTHNHNYVRKTRTPRPYLKYAPPFGIPARHQLTTPAPAPGYSEDPEPVYPEPVYPTPVHPTPINPTSPDSVSQQHTGSTSAMQSSYTPTPINGEKEYPFQPDSVGGDPNTHSEKAYPNQPQQVYQQGDPQGPQQFYTPYGHPSGYATVVPLHCVQSAPCPVDCPVCGEREMTRIEPVSGGTTQ